MIELKDALIFLWMLPSLSGGWRGACLGLLAVLPFLFLFRRPAAAFAGKHLHWTGVTPKTLGLLAPSLSILAGTLLWFTRQPQPAIQWHLTREGAVLKSVNGETSLRWPDVESVTFDVRSPSPENASLIVKTKDGKEAWFVLSWLQPAHREKLLSWINAQAPGKLGVITGDLKKP